MSRYSIKVNSEESEMTSMPLVFSSRFLATERPSPDIVPDGHQVVAPTYTPDLSLDRLFTSTYYLKIAIP